MTDKERILMVIITRIIPGLMFNCFKYEDREKYVESNMLDGNKFLNKGDLVYANTSIYPNDFCVGFVEEVKDDCVVIREIGSERLCNYSNESFSKINKDKIGYEILEGKQYKTYQMVLKAFCKYANYPTRFKSIRFEDNICYVQARRMFSNESEFEFSFEYDGKNTIKSIGKLIKENKNLKEEPT